jgi:surface-anchored protein
LRDSQIVLLKGHSDVMTFLLDCSEQALDISVSEDLPVGFSQKVRRSPSSVLVYGSSDAQVVLPDPADAPGFEALGEPGKEVWILPEVQIETVVWPGWNAYDVPRGSLQGDSIDVELLGVDGPGSFHAFVLGPDNLPDFLFNPADGVMHTTMASSAHTHMNWVFGAPGVYRLRFQASARLSDGSAVTTEEYTLRFFLGELSDLPVSERTVIRIDGLLASYGPDEVMVLEAALFGAPSSLPVEWSRQCFNYETLEWGLKHVLDDGPMLSVRAADVRGSTSETCQIGASLMDGDTEYATAQPVVPLVQ